jgi:hypothetical protein
MKKLKLSTFIITISCVCGVFLSFQSSFAQGTTVSYSFSGTTSITIGGIPENTPFTGTFTYNDAVAGTTTPYYGGTQTIFPNAYSALTVTIGGNTVSETVPGAMAMYVDVNPPNSIPVGDSLYSFNPLNGVGPNASTGSFATYGTTPDFMYLGFVDLTGTAFSGTSLPSTLNLSEFNQEPIDPFIGIDYGPLGSGNTDTISGITSLSEVPEPEIGWLIAFGLAALFRAKWYRQDADSSGVLKSA